MPQWNFPGDLIYNFYLQPALLRIRKFEVENLPIEPTHCCTVHRDRGLCKFLSQLVVRIIL